MRFPILFVVCLFVSAIFVCGCKKAPKPEIKNYILISVDTLRADHLGAWGYKNGRTPNIDDLSRRGVQFDTAIAVAPITMTAHASLLTSLYPVHHGVRNNGSFVLDKSKETLAERFSAAGYDTAAVVGAFVLDSRYGLDQGFRVYDDDLHDGDQPPMFMFKEIRADKVIDKAIKLADGELREPFFLWIHLFDPHADYNPPPPFDVLFLKNPYDGEVAFVDKQLGRFFSALKSKGLDKRTLTVFTSDHGDSLGEHGEQTHGIFVYRSTTHVPLVFQGPGLEPHKVSGVVSQVDVAPTLLDLAGLAQIPGDGLSLAQAIGGKTRAPERKGVLVESLNPRLHFGWKELRGVDSGDAKYIQAPKPEYYDLAADPAEKKNLWAEKRAGADSMAAFMNPWFKDDAVEKLEIRQVDDETRAMLEALGYVADAHVSKDENLSDPKDVAAGWIDLQMCQDMVRRAKYEKAVPCLQKVLEKEPGNWTAYMSLAGSYRRLQKFQEAEAVLKKALDQDPNNVKTLENLAQIYADTKRDDEAAAAFKRAAEAGKCDPEPWGLLGDFYQERGKTKDAIEAYGESLKCDETYVQAFIGLANSFHKVNATSKAQSYLEEAVKLDPKNHAAWYNLGVVQDALGRPKESEDAYRRASALDPKHAMTLNNLGSLLNRQGRKDEAVAVLQQALKVDPKHVESRFNLASILLDSDVETAMRMLQQLVNEKPEMVPIRLILARGFEKQNQIDQAMEQYRYITEQNENAPGVFLSMARLEVKRGRTAEARKLLKKAVALDGERAKTHIKADPLLSGLI